ncbi:MAG: glycosyltransferase [Coriobacteriia bacterium]|nr:glycosyltransferase [Coriobacteriia bacterium]
MKPSKILYLTKKAIYFAWYRHHFLIPPRVMYKYVKSFLTAAKRGNTTSNLMLDQNAYAKWFEEHMKPLSSHKNFKYNPKFSFIVPSFNPEEKVFEECIDSLLNQSYKNFEIVICDDASDNIDYLNKYLKNDKVNIVYRKENGMISRSSNDAIDTSTGDFIVLVDNDDAIHVDSLYYFAEVLNKDKDVDLIYSDEDKLDYRGKLMEPHFKPDYSPDTLMSLNYICHLTCIRKSLVDKVGKFRSEFDGSQDYDLFLRCIEQTDKIFHVPKVLYHWRQTKTSTAGFMDNKNYAVVNGKKALEDSLKRRNIKGEVLNSSRVTAYLTKYHHENELISIIIPMHDKCELTKQCIDSLYEKCAYQNFETIIANNRSQEQASKDYFKEVVNKHDNIKIVDIDEDFNYSRINNIAAKHAKGDYLLFLNNDTEVSQPDFLEWMLGYAKQDHVGCVGIKLLYPNKLVQHCGVVIGFGGAAGHVFVADSYEDNGIFGRLALPYNFSAVTAACMMIKKSKFEGFDENLKVALNDVDLCLSVMDKGYYNVCLANVEMIHHESKSRGYEASKEKHERFMAEEEYLINKWGKLDKDKFFSEYYF